MAMQAAHNKHTGLKKAQASLQRYTKNMHAWNAMGVQGD